MATLDAIARQKSLGAFYTPQAMATKMTQWALRHPGDTVLDPSFGGLVFLRAARVRLRSLGQERELAGAKLFGCDVDAEAYAAALAHQQLDIPKEHLLHRDFFAAKPDVDLPKVSAVIGNPPYVRYQLANGDGGLARRVAGVAGVKLTALSSMWAPFTVHASSFVASGGRMALVLPAELLHAQYAKNVLGFVETKFARTTLVMFRERVFPGAQEEVVLLLAEERGGARGEQVRLVEHNTLADLDIGRLLSEGARRSSYKSPRRPAKLLAQLLPSDVQELYRSLSEDLRTSRLESIASVDIGAVTGANNYFLLDENAASSVDCQLLRPTVSKAMHVSGAVFRSDDFEKLRERGVRCRMFVADAKTPAEALATAGCFLDEGIRRRIHERYKCRVRTPWWSVPLPRNGAPDLFLTYCAAEYPRLVLNEARALNTNTLHGVTLKAGHDARSLAAVFPNSLTMLSVELEGRSYGGGVLKLEPSEAEALVLPPIPPSIARHLDEIDSLLRAKEVGAVLELVDSLVLVEALGLTSEEITMLRSGAAKLRARRRARGKRPLVG